MAPTQNPADARAQQAVPQPTSQQQAAQCPMTSATTAATPVAITMASDATATVPTVQQAAQGTTPAAQRQAVTEPPRQPAVTTLLDELGGRPTPKRRACGVETAHCDVVRSGHFQILRSLDVEDSHDSSEDQPVEASKLERWCRETKPKVNL